MWLQGQQGNYDVGQVKEKCCYMVSFCHIRTDSYISDHHPIVRHQLYKLPSFKEKKKKKLRSFLVPLHLDWKRHQCPQFCCLSHLDVSPLFSAFLACLGSPIRVPSPSWVFVLVLTLAHPCSRKLDLSLCTVGTSSAFLQTADNILSLDLHCDL